MADSKCKHPSAIVNQKTSATAGKRKENPSAMVEERAIRESVVKKINRSEFGRLCLSVNKNSSATVEGQTLDPPTTVDNQSKTTSNSIKFSNVFKGSNRAGFQRLSEAAIKFNSRATQALKTIVLRNHYKEENQAKPKQRRVLKIFEFWEIAAAAIAS